LRDTETNGKTTPGKLYFGPLWDFDFVWGSLPVEGFDNTRPQWIQLLRRDPQFVELLEERWGVLDGILERVTCEGGLLDGYIQEMNGSWEANRDKWPKDHLYGWENGSCEESIEELRSHIDARRAWIRENLGLLKTSYYYLTFMDGEELVYSNYVTVGSLPYRDPPELEDRGNLLFMGWYTKDHVAYDSKTLAQQDTVFHAEFVDASTVSAATEIFLAPNEMWIVYGGSHIT
jgi:hypothetical protein